MNCFDVTDDVIGSESKNIYSSINMINFNNDHFIYVNNTKKLAPYWNLKLQLPGHQRQTHSVSCLNGHIEHVMATLTLCQKCMLLTLCIHLALIREGLLLL